MINCSILACNSKLWTFLNYKQWWILHFPDKRGSTVNTIQSACIIWLFVQDAIAANSYFHPIRSIDSGDTTAAFTSVDHVLSGEIRVGGQVSFYSEYI